MEGALQAAFQPEHLLLLPDGIGLFISHQLQSFYHIIGSICMLAKPGFSFQPAMGVAPGQAEIIAASSREPSYFFPGIFAAQAAAGGRNDPVFQRFRFTGKGLGNKFVVGRVLDMNLLTPILGRAVIIHRRVGKDLFIRQIFHDLCGIESIVIGVVKRR